MVENYKPAKFSLNKSDVHESKFDKHLFQFAESIKDLSYEQVPKYGFLKT
jgi:hypothetical protein